MTCWSCSNYREAGCYLGIKTAANRTYPGIGHACVSFDYEPGSDEAVRLENHETGEEIRCEA